MDGRRSQTSSEFSITSKSRKLSEKKACPDIRHDFVDLTSQVQFMSQTFASCKNFRNHRSLRKDCDSSKSKSEIWRNANSTDTMLKSYSGGERNDVLVNFLVNEKDFLHLRRSRAFMSREEILTKRYSEESVWSERCSSFTTCEMPTRSSKVGMYDYRAVDSGRMLRVLARELKSLAALAPSVVLIASNLTENLQHCLECRRCHEKVSSSLPWILNRIQKLIKYVTTRRDETYLWPNDFSYLRLDVSDSTLEGTLYSSSRDTLIPVSQLRFLGKLEKVDALAVSEDRPGVQILLEVKPDLEKKKFFYPAWSESRWEQVDQAAFAVVRLKEHTSASVVEVLNPKPNPSIVWQKKQQVVLLGEYGVLYRAVYLRNPRVPASVTVCSAKGTLVLLRRNRSNSEPVGLVNEQAQSPAKNFLRALFKRNEWKDFSQTPSNSIYRGKTNDNETFAGKFRTISSGLVRDILGEEEKMQVEKVNELEEEVKELKELMLEVHKNQTELGKLLLEKKVFSQLMVKLTDPRMLEEEDKAVKNAFQFNAPTTSSSSTALQMKVDSLKRKCELKNRLIITLLKGLRSNVPKELWEEVVSYAFDDSESVDEFNSEKINEFIRQTALLLTNEEKERKLAVTPSRIELQSAEEELKVKGIMGEDSLKNLSCYENQAAAESKRVSSRFESSLSRVWAFPGLTVPENRETAVKNLENQISILNLENERLLHQVSELRKLLKHSMNEVDKFEKGRRTNKITASGKTISLVIEIGEKDAQNSNEGELFSCSEVEIGNERIRTSPVTGVEKSELITAIHEAEREYSPTESARKLTLIPTRQNYGTRAKSCRRRSENDLNYLDEVNPYFKREDEKFQTALRERTHLGNRAQGLGIRSPSTSHEMFQSFKPVVWVPSKHAIPEVSEAYAAGPSRKHVNITNMLQKPSLTELAEIQCSGMYATMSNERELQTIPENDPDSTSNTSRNVSQAIQRLRARVRSLHKEMTVLRSKNDRIDKLLEKLMDDVVENNYNYETLESNLSNIKSRLG